MELPWLHKGTVFLAPMAGVTDSAFRRLCRRFGCDVVTTEMVSARALVMGDKRTPKLMEFHEEERPIGIQLFGYDPDDFRKVSAQVEERYRPDFIDINMGCPTPKITNNGAGSALMRTPDVAAAIVRAVAERVSVPVTVKIRAGYNENTAPELAPLLEEAGASLITVHGRTRERMYRPPVDLDVIREVKRRVSVPVVGNGEIETGEDAAHMMAYTGCDAVAVGRAAMGDPFRLGCIRAQLMGETPPPEPTLEQRLAVLREQVVMMAVYKGEYIALQEARKHAAWTLKGIRGAAKLRAEANSLATFDDLDRYIETTLRAARQG